MAFFPSYVALARLYEERNYPLFTAIPLRKTIIQSHVTIDTDILYSSILGISRREANNLPLDELWGQVVNLKSNAFRHRRNKNLSFNGTISTNGTNLSVHLSSPDAHPYGHWTFRHTRAAMQAEINAMYVDHHSEEIRLAPNIIVIDPNKRDTLYCQDRNQSETLRYTSSQRARETGSRLFHKP